MRLYTALLKSDAEPVLVREGFAWGAFFFGPFWLAAHRAWIPAAIALAVAVLTGALVPGPAHSILMVGYAVILGLTGNDLRRWSLEISGFVLVHVVAAQTLDDAFARLLQFRPDLIARSRPSIV